MQIPTTTARCQIYLTTRRTASGTLNTTKTLAGIVTRKRLCTTASPAATHKPGRNDLTRASYSSRLSVNVGQSFSSGHYLLAAVTESDDDKKEAAITDAVKSVSDDSDSPSQISAFQFSEGSIFENVPPPATHPSVNNGGDGGYYEWQKAQGGQIERGYQFWNTVGSSSQLNSNPTNQNVTTSHNDDGRTAADEDKDDKESVHYTGADDYDDYTLRPRPIGDRSTPWWFGSSYLTRSVSPPWRVRRVQSPEARSAETPRKSDGRKI